MKEMQAAREFGQSLILLIQQVEGDIVELESLMRANFLVVVDEVQQDSEEGEGDPQ